MWRVQKGAGVAVVVRGEVLEEASIPECVDLGECVAECSPIMDMWGACFAAHNADFADLTPRERCQCAPRNDEVLVASLQKVDREALKGDGREKLEEIGRASCRERV